MQGAGDSEGAQSLGGMVGQVDRSHKVQHSRLAYLWAGTSVAQMKHLPQYRKGMELTGRRPQHHFPHLQTPAPTSQQPHFPVSLAAGSHPALAEQQGAQMWVGRKQSSVCTEEANQHHHPRLTRDEWAWAQMESCSYTAALCLGLKFALRKLFRTLSQLF